MEETSFDRNVSNTSPEILQTAHEAGGPTAGHGAAAARSGEAARGGGGLVRLVRQLLARLLEVLVLVRQVALHAQPDVLGALQRLQPVRVEAGVRVGHGAHRQLGGRARGGTLCLGGGHAEVVRRLGGLLLLLQPGQVLEADPLILHVHHQRPVRSLQADHPVTLYPSTKSKC